MTELLEEIKEKGWRQILTECIDDKINADVSVFFDHSEEWHNCAIGEILGFPEEEHAHDVVGYLHKDMYNLGIEFSNHIMNDNKEAALETLDEIQYNKDLIFEAQKKIED